MQTSFKDFFKELVFIDWFRKFKGTTLKSEKIEPTLTEPVKTNKVESQKTSGFNDQ